MSFAALPKELRLQIWALAYHAQPRRYVTLRTHPHPTSHPETTFCPRSSPTPPPTTAHVCRESRAETLFQARKNGHLIHLPLPLLTPDPTSPTPPPRPFYFRFDTDVLLYNAPPPPRPSKPPHAPTHTHFDSSPESGFLPHFLHAAGGLSPATSLTHFALTHVPTLCTDGSVSNCVRNFASLRRILFVAAPSDIATAQQRMAFLRIAIGVVGLYEFDLGLKHPGHEHERVWFDICVRRGDGGDVEVLPVAEWRAWATPTAEWGMSFCPTQPAVYWDVDADAWASD
jgi:hypothetical protein